MDEKQKKLYEFYKQCDANGYHNMQDETESLKAKVIATDLGIKYRDISKTYADAKHIYEEENNRVAREAQLQKTDGKFLMELIGSGRDDKMSILLSENQTRWI